MFLCGQLALSLVLNCWPNLDDPEYALRLGNLQARVAERPALRPVLMLGSSRVACGLRSGLLAVNHGDGGPVVFNFGLCRSGPVMELLCLQRLLADGVHPACIFVEVWPPLALPNAPTQMAAIRLNRLRWSETRALRRFTPDARCNSRQWLESRLTPWLTCRTIVGRRAPSWFLTNKQASLDWEGLDRWGWLAIPEYKEYNNELNPARAKATAKNFIPACDVFVPSADSLRAYAELFALCRGENITVSLVATPDSFLPAYSAAGRRLMDSFLRRLSQENNVALVDARAWASSDAFVDGVHLTHGGAAAFTERFGREVLDPLLNGEPLACRWPPGRLDAPAYAGAASAEALPSMARSNQQNLNSVRSLPH